MNLNKRLTKTDENALKEPLTRSYELEMRTIHVGVVVAGRIIHNGNWNLIGRRKRQQPQGLR
jgi:hypothetical protein